MPGIKARTPKMVAEMPAFSKYSKSLGQRGEQNPSAFVCWLLKKCDLISMTWRVHSLLRCLACLGCLCYNLRFKWKACDSIICVFFTVKNIASETLRIQIAMSLHIASFANNQNPPSSKDPWTSEPSSQSERKSKAGPNASKSGSPWKSKQEPRKQKEVMHAIACLSVKM